MQDTPKQCDIFDSSFVLNLKTMSLWPILRTVLHRELLEKQWRTIDKRREHRGDDWSQLTLQNVSIEEVIETVERLLEDYTLEDKEE